MKLFNVIFFLSLCFIGSTAQALVGAHSYKNETTGDVFLGGDYIEVGISKYGSFGTALGQPKPDGFYATATRNYIGMTTNPAGFGVAPDLRFDYFIPGSPEERWVVGYKIAGTPSNGSNAYLMGTMNISDNAVTNNSSGTTLTATSIGTFNSKVKITQVISFDASESYFKNTITLENIDSTNTLESVRFMRSFDPDNTVDQSGSYTTRNEILYTNEAGDGKAVVRASTANNSSDPVFVANGTYSPIVFYSNDERARVSTFGFLNTDPYAAGAYDSAKAKGTVEDGDQAITITFDVGSLAPGESETVVYYCSLDNRDFDDVLSEIQSGEDDDAGDDDNITTDTEDAAPNTGDGNGDGTPDSEQSNVSSLLNDVVGNGAYVTLQTAGCATITSIAQNAVTAYATDEDYEYPVGLTDFTITCNAAGDTATITVFYDDDYDTTDWAIRKYINGVYEDVDGATLATATVGANTVTTLSYQITDGGELDSDGVADGVIIDPVGPGIVVAEAATAPYTGPFINGSLAHANCSLNTQASHMPNTHFAIIFGLSLVVLGTMRAVKKSAVLS